MTFYMIRHMLELLFGDLEVFLLVLNSFYHYPSTYLPLHCLIIRLLKHYVRVLGAVMFTIVGLIFLRSDVKPTLDANADAVHRKEKRPPARDEMVKNILVGLTMSGINPSLLATYTGAIASGM